MDIPVLIVSITSTNGVSGSSSGGQYPSLLISLGKITPTSVAASGTVTGSNLSGTNTGDQTITLTSDVTGSGTGSFATTISANAVTYAKFQKVATLKLLGNPTGSSANVSEVSLGSAMTFIGTSLTIAASGVTSDMLAGSIASSKLVGTDIATVGTITVGTWHGTAIADSYIASASTWNAKQAAITTGTTAQYFRGDLSLATLNASAVGLGSVTNAAQVTSVSIATANGISGTSSGGQTPSLTMSLGAITPTSVAATGTVSGSNLSGTNTGDQSSISGNAGTATAISTNGCTGQSWSMTSVSTQGWTNNLGMAIVTLSFSATMSATDVSTGSIFGVTLTANVTSWTNPTNPFNGQKVVWKIIQGGSGSYMVAWPSNFNWGAGSSPTLSTAVGSVDYVGAIYDSSKSKWDCFSQLGF